MKNNFSTCLKDRTVLQLVRIDETGDSYYRMRWPGMELANMDSNLRIINLEANALERFNWGEKADLLVIYQSHDLELLPLMQKRRAAGLKTLVEYNDNYYAPPSASPVFPFWSSPLVWQSYELLMQESDGVIVTGEGLKEVLSAKIKKPFYVIQNHLPRSQLDRDLNQKANNLSIGWAGSLGHMSDILWTLPLLREILNSYPDIQLSMMGNKTLEELLKTPKNQTSFRTWGSMKDYYQFLQPLSLGIIPLLHTDYNLARSDIKAVEMAAYKVLPIVPKAKPYLEFIDNCQLQPYQNLEDLRKLLIHYIENREELTRDRERCFKYVESCRIGVCRKERYELYLSMFPELPCQSPISDIAMGYHEFLGIQDNISMFAHKTKHAEMLLKEDKISEAKALIEELLKENPLHFLLHFLHLQCLAKQNEDSFEDEVRKHISRFPNDLRAYLLLLNSKTFKEPHYKKKKKLWASLALSINALPEASRIIFYRGIINALEAEQNTGGNGPETIALLEEFASLYPTSARLKYLLAIAYEQCGNNKKACMEYQKLRLLQQTLSMDKEFITALQYNYLKTWEEALEARSKQV